MLLEIRVGRLVGRHDMSASELDAHRRRMFDAYKRTPAYRRQFAESVKSGMEPTRAEWFLFESESADYPTQSLPPGGAQAADGSP